MTVEDTFKEKLTKNMVKASSKKHMRVLTSTTLRTLIVEANDLEIQKEDVVTLVKENSQYMLVYFK